MKSKISTKDIDELQLEADALDQSVALNRIVMTMLESERRKDLWTRIILAISILVNLLIVGMFLHYESQFTTTETITTTTVEQDTGEGSGSNVYQSGEHAKYVQGDSEEVTPNGEAESYDSNSDQNASEEFSQLG